MAQPTFSVTLSAAQKTALTAKAAAAGIDPGGGTLPTEHGVTLSFAVSGDVVIFTVLSKPFFVSLGMIENGIEQLIDTA